jgi:hypothetical protein
MVNTLYQRTRHYFNGKLTPDRKGFCTACGREERHPSHPADENGRTLIAMSKEERMFHDVRELVMNSTVSVGDRLPSYSSWVRKYQISAATVSRVVFALRMCGFVYGLQGEGIFVSDTWKNTWIERVKDLNA